MADEVEHQIVTQEAERGEVVVRILISWVAIAFCATLAYYWAVTHPLRFNSPKISALSVAGLAGAFGILHVLLYRFVLAEWWFEFQQKRRNLKRRKMKHRMDNRDAIIDQEFSYWKQEEAWKDQRRKQKVDDRQRSGGLFRRHGPREPWDYDTDSFTPDSYTEVARREEVVPPIDGEHL